MIPPYCEFCKHAHYKHTQHIAEDGSPMTEAQVKALTPKDEIAVLLTELEKQFPAVQAAPEAPQVPPLVPPVAAPIGDVAQPAEHRIVDPKVAGAEPVVLAKRGRPRKYATKQERQRANTAAYRARKAAK